MKDFGLGASRRWELCKSRDNPGLVHTVDAQSTPGLGAPGWLSPLSFWCLISAQVMISQFLGSRPASGSELTVWNLLGILSRPLAAPPHHLLSLKINVFFFFLNSWVRIPSASGEPQLSSACYVPDSILSALHNSVSHPCRHWRKQGPEAMSTSSSGKEPSRQVWFQSLGSTNTIYCLSPEELTLTHALLIPCLDFILTLDWAGVTRQATLQFLG